MSLLFVLIPVFAGTGLGWALSRRPVQRVGIDEVDLLCRLRRRARLAIVLGMVAGAVAMALVIIVGPGPAVAPMAGSAVLLLALCAAELTTPSASGPVRSATLGTRRLGSYLSHGALRLAVTGPLALVGLLALGTAMGDADDLGRSGRALSTTCGAVTSTHSPWPGWHYALPMLIGLALALLAAVVTLVAVVRRRRTSAESAQTDEAARATAVRRVLLTTAATGFVSCVPVSALMASALVALDCRPGWYPVLGGGMALVTVVCTILGSGCLGAAIAGSRIVRRESAHVHSGETR